MRRVLCACVAGLMSVGSYAQISSFASKTESKAEAKDEKCPAVIIVRPDITTDVVGSKFQTSELSDAAKAIADAVSSKFDKRKTVGTDELKDIEECASSRVLFLKVKEYKAEEAQMGQHAGTMTVVVYFFKSPKDKDPSSQEEFTATGERSWGDSAPLQNAVKEMANVLKGSKKIK